MPTRLIYPYAEQIETLQNQETLRAVYIGWLSRPSEDEDEVKEKRRELRRLESSVGIKTERAAPSAAELIAMGISFESVKY